MTQPKFFAGGVWQRMLITLMMGFACGLPLALTGDLLKNWFSREGIDISIIGALSLIGLPYTFKFIWAPLFDRYQLNAMGRRRSWLMLIQLALMISIAMMGFVTPTHHLFILVSIAFLIAFFSSSQDVVVDAYRREHLKNNELGIGSSVYTYGYRIGMLVSASGGILLTDFLSFNTVYFLLSACVLIFLLTTYFSPEPIVDKPHPRTLISAVIDPLREYFTRRNAILILVFILLYKLGDNLAANMTQTLYVELGYSNSEIGLISKFFGFVALMLGALIGGLIIFKYELYRSLWLFGILQMVSTAGFAVLYEIGYDIRVLAAVIAFENLTAGMGSAAFIAFMARLTNKQFTAVQYALLTSLMGVPRVIASASTGFLIQWIGWTEFYVFCTLIAIPGLLILRRFADWNFDSSVIGEKDSFAIDEAASDINSTKETNPLPKPTS